MRRVAIALTFLMACRETPTSPPPARAVAPETKVDDSERGNLLDIARGASVVSRTGELTLDMSPLRAIDGDKSTWWNSALWDGKNQTIVYALPARTLVESIGIRTDRKDQYRVSALRLESSLDGANFSPLASLKLNASGEMQTFSISPPRDIVYLRLTTVDVPGQFATIASIAVHGAWQEKPKQPPIDGCWSINGFATQFRSDRGWIVGTIADEHPISFLGGADGLIYRFVWTSGPDYGFGALVTTPDGKHLSGMRWYVEPRPYSAAEGWFGEQSSCGRTPAREDVATNFLQKSGRLPLYGSDDAALDLIAGQTTRVRLVSREFRFPDSQENRRQAQIRLEAFREKMRKRGIDPARFDWVVAGDQNPPQPIENEIMRVMYSVIDLSGAPTPVRTPAPH